VLDELIDRYGTGAVLTVSPYVLDGGETYAGSSKSTVRKCPTQTFASKRIPIVPTGC
jgi:hypothetical protein